jgi:murein DD-endopeptidase MepM/ murein hydrolase activator NlpD
MRRLKNKDWRLSAGRWKFSHYSLFIVSLFIVSCASASFSAAGPIIVSATPRATGTSLIEVVDQSQYFDTATPYPTTDFQTSGGDVAPTNAIISDPPTTVASPLPTDPIRFDFGTYTPVPTLSWRPPPLPVPVSIRPEDHFWFARPIASNAVNWPHPLYRYGSTYFGNMRAHAGVDLDSPLGTPVLAAGPGVVVWAGYGLFGVKPVEDDPYGLAVAVKHDFGYNNETLYTIYAHMSAINVWVDQPVKMGEQIGLVGSTGFSSGPHLHFEVRIGQNKFRNTYNPELWLAPPTGWGVLAGRVLDAGGRYIPELPIEVIDSSRRHFQIVSYANTGVMNADPVYKENFVISDLPAGTYTYTMFINGEEYTGATDIRAGQTTFVIIQENVHDIARTALPAATDGKAPTLTPTPKPSRTPTPKP